MCKDGKCELCEDIVHFCCTVESLQVIEDGYWI